jgi:carbonic anhydrase
MKKFYADILRGYKQFREKYTTGDHSIMNYLADNGQRPQVMVVACCDSRVDPALILQCDPGELFVVRNVANIVPPYEKDEMHHGTSAALEFGVCYLNVEHIIILGHSQCGGISALLNEAELHQNDFISNWVSLIKPADALLLDQDACAKQALIQSKLNCMTFPWIKSKVTENLLIIDLWYFDIKTGQIFAFDEAMRTFLPLSLED